MATKTRFKSRLEKQYSEFVEKYLSDADDFMANKLALLCTVFSIINCVILVLISFETDFKPVISLCILSMVAMIIVSVYLILAVQKTLLAANISLVFLSIVYLPIMWIYTGGINGSASLILFMLIVFNAILNGGRIRFGIAFTQFATILILFYIEITYPANIMNFTMASEGHLGVMLNMFYILVSTTLVTAYFIDQYKQSLMQVKKTNEQLNLANEDLKLAAQFRRDLTANISHDLNTPITMICGYAEAINDGLLNKEQTTKYLDLIQQKSMDLSNLIDDLLHLTKLENKQLEMNYQLIFLKELIDEQRMKFTYDIQLSNLEFIVKKLPDKLVNSCIKVDTNQINKVFNNIFYNALKFTTKGSITLSCQVENDNRVVIAIEDTGPGISEDILPYIFQRFYKGSPSRNSKTKGSGLGLNISQKIVRLHGGDIWVTSEVGQGSTFYFSLPLAD